MSKNARLKLLLIVVVLSAWGPSAWALEEEALLGDYVLAPDVVLTLSRGAAALRATIGRKEPVALLEEACCRYSIPELEAEVRFSQMERDADIWMRLERYGQTITARKKRPGDDRGPEPPDELTARLEQWVPVWMVQHNVPGVSIAMIRDRQIVWSRQFGFKRADRPDRIDEASVFEACSMSKPLFAYAVMKLVEARKLSLDRSLDAYLPKPYLPDEPQAGQITARMVLNHTTGLPNWRKGGRRDGTLTLDHKPGERFTYSGEGMWYLQRVVEQITGKPINEYMTETVMGPIGMDRSSYLWQDRYPENYAHGHDKEGKPRNYGYYTDGNTAFSLYTTPVDYARYLIVMMDAAPEEDFQLQLGTIDRMLTIQSQRGPDYYYGLGWAIGGPPGRRYVFHGGSNGSGFRCHARFYRGDGSGIVVMTNAIDGAALYGKILDEVYPPSGEQ